MLVVGALGLVVGFATIASSTLAYSATHDFSFFTTYISDFGAAPGWPAALFSSGMLLAAPLRYLFLVLLLIRLADLGASRRSCGAMAIVGAAAVLGSIGTAAVPFTLNAAIHKSAALLYFFGTVALQAAIASQEWRLRLPRVLPLTSIAVVAAYFVFATLLALVGKTGGVDRTTPVPWEWLSFLTLMAWLAAHTVVLGSRPSLPKAA